MTIEREGRATIMTMTLLYGTRPACAVNASREGDDVWLAADALPAATGWVLKAEGLCQDDRCVRVPEGVPLVRRNHPTAMGRQDQVNLTVFANLLGQPVLHDDAHAVWCFGEAAPAEAPRADVGARLEPDLLPSTPY